MIAGGWRGPPRRPSRRSCSAGIASRPSREIWTPASRRRATFRASSSPSRTFNSFMSLTVKTTVSLCQAPGRSALGAPGSRPGSRSAPSAIHWPRPGAHGAGHVMVADPLVFRDLAYVFAAALLGGALAWLSRQPLILGYVLGGILIGPFTPGPTISDVHTFELFAEIGVVLLMFSIGIEFSLRDLLRVKWVALIGGPLGIVLTAALGAGAGLLLGWPPLQGLTVGLVISVASTMVLVRLLMDRGELHTLHGRVLIGLSLVE